MEIKLDGLYPVENGIVNCLPPDMQEEIEPNREASHFLDVHREMRDPYPSLLLMDKSRMAHLQRRFYDRMAVAFEGMDEADRRSGGVFWWKIMRLFRYDNRLLGKPGKLLFIGAGNCRLARLFAQAGWEVTATDISREMLKIGRDTATRLGLDMAYVAHNAEERFPFASDQFDAVYSLCVINHIVDWRNYINEKVRCLKPGGILLERMPNIDLWKFWRHQGELYQGIEAKALDCNVDNARQYFRTVKSGLWNVSVWTHDRQPRILLTSKLPLSVSRPIYHLRCAVEDRRKNHDLDNRRGIYTLVYGRKP